MLPYVGTATRVHTESPILGTAWQHRLAGCCMERQAVTTNIIVHKRMTELGIGNQGYSSYKTAAGQAAAVQKELQGRAFMKAFTCRCVSCTPSPLFL